MNPRLLAVFGALALAIAGAALFYLQSQGPAPSPAPVAIAPSMPHPATTVEKKTATPPPMQIAPAPIAGAPSPAAPPPTPIPEWDKKISRILEANAGETETAQMLINLLPTLPPDGQAEAAQHISNLITDKDYNRVLPLLRNPNLPEEVQDVLVTDLMNRDDTVKLPALLDIAKLPNHPYHEEALTDLQIFLDADNGQDWGKWNSSLKDYLKKQAAANADVSPPPQ